MMNRIRTRIESKITTDQMQSYYAWRPGSRPSLTHAADTRRVRLAQ